MDFRVGKIGTSIISMENQETVSIGNAIVDEKRGYALRSRSEHRRLAGRWGELYRLLTNFNFLEDKCKFLSTGSQEDADKQILNGRLSMSLNSIHSAKKLFQCLHSFFSRCSAHLASSAHSVYPHECLKEC